MLNVLELGVKCTGRRVVKRQYDAAGRPYVLLRRAMQFD